MEDKILNYFNGDELAADVWKSKYALQGEETPDDMHHRLADNFARVEIEEALKTLSKEYEYNALSKNGKLYTDYISALKERGLLETGLNNYIYNLFKNFQYIIPQGSVMANLGTNTPTSLSNCFVIGQPHDSYAGIFEKDEQLVQIMKRRGGVGIDISTLKPYTTPVNNAAKTSTGAVSFVHRFSNSTREVAQDGRRGALMISMDINHPDILEFIKVKRDLSKVTGANISVKMNNEFMKAVEKDDDYFLRFPVDMKVANWPEELTPLNKLVTLYNMTDKPCYIKRIRAKEYWNELVKSNHLSAEPGIMFWDKMTQYSPESAYPEFKQTGTNPCSEIAMQPFDSCRLLAVNLFSFVDKPFTDEATFNLERFYDISYDALRMGDNLVTLEQEAISRIIDKIKNDINLPCSLRERELSIWENIYMEGLKTRRIGVGFTALGDTLAALGYKYDSPESMDIIESIMSTKMHAELDCTIDLAILRGPFDANNPEEEFYYKDITLRGKTPFYDFIALNYAYAAKRMLLFGRRNLSWSTVAPTGSVSILTQTTSGIEPLFQPFYIRRKKVTSDSERVDFKDQNGDKWQEFPVLHPKFRDWICTNYFANNYQSSEFLQRIEDKNYLELAFKDSPWYSSTANDIDWQQRVKIQGLIQKYISHSISSTINLPENVSEEEVSNIYLNAWKEGLKGVTIYRENSRSGVLVTKKEEKEEFKETEAPKRPKSLIADYYQVKVKGTSYIVLVGLLNNRPYEIFVFKPLNPVSIKQHKGQITKIKKGEYTFDSEYIKISNLQNSTETTEEKAHSLMISMLLRHGAPLKFVIKTAKKVDDNIGSFSSAMCRILSKYTKTEELVCPQCGGKLVMEAGCATCKDCGWSRCD